MGKERNSRSAGAAAYLTHSVKDRSKGTQCDVTVRL